LASQSLFILNQSQSLRLNQHLCILSQNQSMRSLLQSQNQHIQNLSKLINILISQLLAKT
jgi:hypothetical protein